MKKTIFILSLLLLAVTIFVQEMQIDGNLKLNGDLIFQDETTMNTVAIGIPVGVIVPFAGINAPEGWLLCDGSAISREFYSDLFSIIGENYGNGNASSTFNLPDMRGKNNIGYDETDVDFDTLGTTGGEKEHTLVENEIPPFSKYSSHSSTDNNDVGQYSHCVTHLNTTTFGGGEAHNILDPYIVVNYIIKY